MPQQTIAQDVASIIAKQVSEQIEQVKGMGILTASDRKAVDDFLYEKFVPEDKKNLSDYYSSERVHYSMSGDYIDFKRDFTTAYNTTDADFFIIVFTTDKTTRRAKRQTVTTTTYTSIISLHVVPKEEHMKPKPLFTTRYVGNESISRESAMEMFEKVLDVMRKMDKCSVCEVYKHDIVCRKNGIHKQLCPECHMHARVKRARTL